VRRQLIRKIIKYLSFFQSSATLFLCVSFDQSKEVGLEVNTEKTKYMSKYRHQNSGRNHNVQAANRSFENAAELRYFGTATRNRNCIREEMKRWLNSDNSWYHSVYNRLSSRFSKYVKLKIYKTVTLAILYGREIWSFALREAHRLWAFDNRVLWRISGSKRDGVIGGWRTLHNEILHNLYFLPNIIRMIKSMKMKWTEHVTLMAEKCIQSFDKITWKEGTTTKV
jgi:hypothetical protein